MISAYPTAEAGSAQGLVCGRRQEPADTLPSFLTLLIPFSLGINMLLCPAMYCTEPHGRIFGEQRHEVVAGGGVGAGYSLLPKHNGIYVAAFGVSPTFCTTNMFFIISWRNQPLLGLGRGYGCYLGSGPPENPPSPAQISAACTCFFSLGGEGVGGRPRFPSLAKPVRRPLVSRGCFTPWHSP